MGLQFYLSSEPMAVEIFVVKNPPLRCDFRNYALLMSVFEDVTAKGIPVRVATNLNNTKPPQLPGGLWSFDQGDPGSHLLM